MSPLGILVIVALVFVLGAGAVFLVITGVIQLPENLLRRRIGARVREVGLTGSGPGGEATLIKQTPEGPLPMLDRLASRSSYGSALARLIEQAGMKVSVSALVVGAVVMGIVTGLVIGGVLRGPFGFPLGLVVGGSVPFLVLRQKKRARLKRFEEQFPETLDLLSRALRAGHAFTTAIGMVADEGPDPTGPEFKKTYDEQNFGLPLKDALNNLTLRVPLLDVRFFVTAVLIQRETGGNLAEILDNLANVVRERFKILRQVRVHTAHGRFTGFVLVSLPAALMIVLYFINPEHISVLFKERMGQIMLTAAIVLQIIGYIWIRRVIKIEV